MTGSVPIPHTSINYCGFVLFRLFPQATAIIFRGLAADKVGDAIEMWSQYQSKLTIRGMWTLGCTNIIAARNGSLYVTDLEGNVANVTGYGILIGGCVGVVFEGVILGGTLNDVQWQSTGAAAAYPGIGASITDGNGAFCVRMT